MVSRKWKFQGSKDSTIWSDIGEEQTVETWEYTANKANPKEFSVDFNDTEYKYYRMRITHGRYTNTSTNYTMVSVGELRLFSEAPMTATEMILEGNTLTVDNIPDDATSVELFRDSVKLTDMEIVTPSGPQIPYSASVQVGATGSYQAIIKKNDYLLVETVPLVVTEFQDTAQSGPLLSTTTNTDSAGSTSNVSTATPAEGTDYIYLTQENEPRFASHTTAGYSGLKWTSDTATLYLKFTTSSSMSQGSLFMSDSNYDGNGPDAPLFEHWWNANNKNMQLFIANGNTSGTTHAVSANIYYDLQPNTTYEWVYHFGPNGYFDVIVNDVEVPVTQQNNGPYYAQVSVYGTNVTSSVRTIYVRYSKRCHVR